MIKLLHVDDDADILEIAKMAFEIAGDIDGCQCISGYDALREVNEFGSIRISYALSDAIERNVNAGGAHGPSRLSGLAI